MKIVGLLLLGLAAGSIFYHIPRWIDDYANSPLPEPWQGPKYRHWHDGIEYRD